MTGAVFCVTIEPDGDLFHAYCPDLPGLHVCGDTEEGALAESIDAVEAYLLSMIKHGETRRLVMGERA